MAVTWLDVPNFPISRREPLDFIVDTDPVAISVKFPGLRVEERVWRDSSFQYPYLNSTVTGSGPYTFHLNRTGGWPADSTVYVDEGGGTGGGSQPWRQLYSVDFTALPEQTFGSFGAHTIDGLTWYIKEGEVPGQAYIDSSGFLVGKDGTGESSDAFFGPWFILPMSSIPGYNPAAPVVFYARTNRDAGSYCITGVVDCALNGVKPTIAERRRRQAISSDGSQPPAVDNALSYIWHQNSANNTSPDETLGVLPQSDVGYATYVLNRKSVQFGLFDWSAGVPDPWSGAIMMASSGNSIGNLSVGSLSGTPLARNMNNVCFFAGYNNSSGVEQRAYLLELIVWQPGV